MAVADLPEELFNGNTGAFRKSSGAPCQDTGFSCGYGLPGMGALAEHLQNTVDDVLTTDEAKNIWRG